MFLLREESVGESEAGKVLLRGRAQIGMIAFPIGRPHVACGRVVKFIFPAEQSFPL